ncbi:conserved hypothetical protein [Methylocella silvestris BL2]|uniref:HdeD family acid-resistance protein n=1 Tax=Methylocella silvestris (strain DSM 15510 / CIP 108128 / LMG 27833 / NCIMB 13906 / BL2) TaxID=395965 RepID=B8EMI6_METSB|nr:conserved hypothetical protein [Methylocella silvestris BL2]
MSNNPATNSPTPIPPDPLAPGSRLLAGSLGRAMGAHWKLILAEGILLLVLGVLAVMTPFVAGVATALFLGWLFLFSGVAGLIFTYQSRGDPGFWWALLSSAVAVLAGLALLANPVGGLFSLTFVLIAYFIVDGVVTIMLGLEQRRHLSGGWQWVVFSGVVDLILAALVISGLPGSFLWAVGLLVGIDLAFAGASIISIALAARKAASA